MIIKVPVIIVHNKTIQFSSELCLFKLCHADISQLYQISEIIFPL